MDVIAGLLDGPRARGAFVLRSVLAPPWSMRIEDEAPLTIAAVVRGRAVLVLDDGRVEPMGAGDLAILRGPEPYTMADEPSTAPQVRILPGQVCVSPDGTHVKGMGDLGVRTWGNSLDGDTVLVTGTYQMHSEVGHRLLNALPVDLILRADDWDCPLIAYLGDEIGRDEPGQEAVLDRLLDLLLIAALRSWFARPEADTPGWYRATADPVVGPALRLLHARPGEPWSVAMLAAEVGVSRAALARRFCDLVGEAPMTYLTAWRLTIAADLLREPEATVASVARQVGYGSAFALSTAFKRVRGISPAAHRAIMA
jgi:AraC-like DNA-binding protein